MNIKKLLVVPSVAFLALVGNAAGAVADNNPLPPPEKTTVDTVVENAGSPSGHRVCPSSPTYVAGVNSGCTNDLGMSWHGGCWASSTLKNNQVLKVESWPTLGADYYKPGGGGWDAAGGVGETTGTLYFCYTADCSADVSKCLLADVFWSADGVVSPGVVAERAVASMGLTAPQIGMTGGDPPDGMQIVGVPAWLWAADPGDSTTGPITRTATDGNISVTATGVLEKTTWRMGDGVTVTCNGANAAGTPWEPRYGGMPSPTCGYTYTRSSFGMPNEAFTVTVTAYWRVDWSGNGESGVITRQVGRSIPKRVGEIQAILVPNPGGGS